MKLFAVFFALLGSCKQGEAFFPCMLLSCELFIALPRGFACLLFSLLPLWNDETMERLQPCAVTTCSGVLVRPSAHARAQASLPAWARAFATARS
jgi:hypothetical protein